MMTQMYTSRRRADSPADAPARTQEAKGPSLQALQAGAAPTTEQLGHPVDLPGAIRAKMEASFGADLSGVRLYESQTVADAGAEAVTMGGRIGFAPGKLDFSSASGQALLGHELSHVVSQARGEVTGRGFLNDHALETRADQEGAMAAAGESVYSGPMTPVSASSTAQAAGPMQAKKPLQKLKENREKKKIENMEISEPKNGKRGKYVKQQEDGSFTIEYLGKDPNKDLKSYNSYMGATLGILMDGMSDDDLRENEALPGAFMPQYIQDTKARLNAPGGGKHSLNLDIINGEQADYNRLLRANVTEDMVNEAGVTNSDLAGKALDKVGSHIRQNSRLKGLLQGGATAMSDAVGGDQEKAKAGILERFARVGLVPALSDKDKSIRRNMAIRNLGPAASGLDGEKNIGKEMDAIGRLNVGTLGSNILDRYDHAKEGEQALQEGSSRVMIGKRPINASVFKDGERYKRSLD